MKNSRRDFLGLIGVAPMLLFAGRAAAAETACYSAASLTMTQKNLRRSVDFSEASPDPKRRCGLCAFFTAAKGNCGSCQIMSGSPVTALGVCTSFAPKG